MSKLRPNPNDALLAARGFACRAAEELDRLARIEQIDAQTIGHIRERLFQALDELSDIEYPKR